MRKQAAILTALLVTFAATPSHAEQSAYTTLDLGACREIPPNPDDPLESGVWHCAGYR